MTTENQNPRVVVIGAGIGGTALTLLLAHAGLRVTLLEKNQYLGGTCAGYEKQGFQVDFSTHMFTRGPKGPLGEVLRRAGHAGAIDFRRTHDIAELRSPARDGSGELVRIAMPSQIHRMPRMGWELARAMQLGPGEIVQAAKLFANMLAMSPAEADTWNHRTVDEYVSQFTDNPRVHAALCFLLGLYFVVAPWETSAGEAIYCFQRMFRDNWLSYPAGGSKAIPLTYCKLAEQYGAEIRTRAGVRRILITDGKVRGVELTDGSVVDADIVVSTSSLRSTALHLVEPGVLPDEYVDRASKIQGSLVAVQAKIALNKKLVDAGCLIGGFGPGGDLLNATGDSMRRIIGQVQDGRVPEMLPFYCPIPTNFDASLAPPGHQLLTVCAVAPTTDITLKDAPAEWEEATMRTMRAIVPNLDEHVVFIDRTTTSWMEHWLGKEYGPAISTGQTPDQVADLRPSVTTPIAGLYLAGDGAGGRGVGTELAADSAMECAETIVAALGRTQPGSWRTDRHALPPIRRSFQQALRPTPVVRG
ncbi:phytoene desaturase family protein [Nocardia fluminea]|uniref:phytoene desaturase family protein n=1 Tax=Nocardia fluminea TaxID=134984 RepID=UPI00342466C7